MQSRQQFVPGKMENYLKNSADAHRVPLQMPVQNIWCQISQSNYQKRDLVKEVTPEVCKISWQSAEYVLDHFLHFSDQWHLGLWFDGHQQEEGGRWVELKTFGATYSQKTCKHLASNGKRSKMVTAHRTRWEKTCCLNVSWCTGRSKYNYEVLTIILKLGHCLSFSLLVCLLLFVILIFWYLKISLNFKKICTIPYSFTCTWLVYLHGHDFSMCSFYFVSANIIL